MDNEEFVSRENSRGTCYKILSDCYYLPNEELLKTLKSHDISGGSLTSALADNARTLEKIEELKVDYSKLFVGPYQLLAPPYGSVYLENTARVMGNSTIDVKTRYATEGLQVDLKEMPDHIAIELEFMYYLISKELEAILNSDSVSVSAYLEKQRDFLENHLGIWVSNFANKVAANAETRFYRSLAMLTELFVKEDLMALSQIPIQTL